MTFILWKKVQEMLFRFLALRGILFSKAICHIQSRKFCVILEQDIIRYNSVKLF